MTSYMINEHFLVQDVTKVMPTTRKQLTCYELLSKDVVSLMIIVIIELWPVWCYKAADLG